MWEQRHPGYGELNKLMPDDVFSYSSNFSLMLSTTKEYLPAVRRLLLFRLHAAGCACTTHREPMRQLWYVMATGDKVQGQVVVPLRGSTQCCDRWRGYRLVSGCLVLTVQQYSCWGEVRERHGDVRGRGLLWKGGNCRGDASLHCGSQLSGCLAHSFSEWFYLLHFLGLIYCIDSSCRVVLSNMLVF
jgi:hypothetical protein